MSIVLASLENKAVSWIGRRGLGFGVPGEAASGQFAVAWFICWFLFTEEYMSMACRWSCKISGRWGLGSDSFLIARYCVDVLGVVIETSIGMMCGIGKVVNDRWCLSVHGCDVGCLSWKRRI